MTFMFLIVILGSTHKNVPAGFAPIAIGLCLTLWLSDLHQRQLLLLVGCRQTLSCPHRPLPDA